MYTLNEYALKILIKRKALLTKNNNSFWYCDINIKLTHSFQNIRNCCYAKQLLTINKQDLGINFFCKVITQFEELSLLNYIINK